MMSRTPLRLGGIKYNKNPEVIEFLLKAKADPNARDAFGSTPWYTLRYGRIRPKAIEFLLKGKG